MRWLVFVRDVDCFFFPSGEGGKGGAGLGWWADDE